MHTHMYTCEVTDKCVRSTCCLRSPPPTPHLAELLKISPRAELCHHLDLLLVLKYSQQAHGIGR
jgi:hypothetical protein